MTNYLEYPRYVLNYKKLAFIGALWGVLSFSVVTSCELNIIKLNIEPQVLVDLSFFPGTLTHNALVALQDRTGFCPGEYTCCLLCAIFTIIISIAIVFAAGIAYQKLLVMREK